jgi:glycosyltransferase involved in cell wall biosynthesis
MLSVIIPANNEADYIGGCLEALLASADPAPSASPGEPAVEIIVVANGCTDATAAVARGYAPAATARGWRLVVLDLRKGGKLNALNAGEREATGRTLVYVDADVIVSPPLLVQLQAALDRPGPAYASGRPTIGRARSWFSRAYARFWLRVPFMTEGVPGCGVFAMNAAGRARWGAYPEIISDDTFARLQFAPAERIGVPAPYQWPIAEGFARLVRVRRRQDLGVAEVARLFPGLVANDDKRRVGLPRLLRLAVSDPVGLGAYAAVALAVRVPAPRSGERWTRGR